VNDKELGKAILDYAKGYAAALFNGEVGAPSQSDCWYCSLSTDDGQPLGDAMGDTNHLLLHIEESYYVPFLLVRARDTHPYYVSAFLSTTIAEMWNGKAEPIPSLHDLMEHQAMRLIRRYMRGQLGLKR